MLNHNILYLLKSKEYYLNKTPIAKIVCKRPKLVSISGSIRNLRGEPYIFEVVDYLIQGGREYYITNTLWDCTREIRIVSERDVRKLFIYKSKENS